MWLYVCMWVRWGVLGYIAVLTVESIVWPWLFVFCSVLVSTRELHGGLHRRLGGRRPRNL